MLWDKGGQGGAHWLWLRKKREWLGDAWRQSPGCIDLLFWLLTCFLVAQGSMMGWGLREDNRQSRLGCYFLLSDLPPVHLSQRLLGLTVLPRMGFLMGSTDSACPKSDSSSFPTNLPHHLCLFSQWGAHHRLVPGARSRASSAGSLLPHQCLLCFCPYRLSACVLIFHVTAATLAQRPLVACLIIAVGFQAVPLPSPFLPLLCPGLPPAKKLVVAIVPWCLVIW